MDIDIQYNYWKDSTEVDLLGYEGFKGAYKRGSNSILMVYYESGKPTLWDLWNLFGGEPKCVTYRIDTNGGKITNVQKSDGDIHNENDTE